MLTNDIAYKRMFVVSCIPGTMTKKGTYRGNAESDSSGSDTEVNSDSEIENTDTEVVNLASVDDTVDDGTDDDASVDDETDVEPGPTVSQKFVQTTDSESDTDAEPVKDPKNEQMTTSDSESDAEPVKYPKNEQMATSDSESDAEQDVDDDSIEGLQAIVKTSVDDLQAITNPMCPKLTPIYAPRNFSDSRSLYSAMDYIFGCDSHIPSEPCEPLKNLYTIIDFFCLVSDIITEQYVITSRPVFFYEAECVAELLKSRLHRPENPWMARVESLLAKCKTEYRDRYIQYAQNNAYPLPGEEFINHMFAMCKTLALMESAHVMHEFVCKEHELYRILTEDPSNKAAERDYFEATNAKVKYQNYITNATPKWSQVIVCIQCAKTLADQKALLDLFYRQSIDTIDVCCKYMCKNPEIQTRLDTIGQMYEDKRKCISSATDVSTCYPEYVNDNHVKIEPVEDSSTTLAAILEEYKPLLESDEKFNIITQGKDQRTVDLYDNFNGMLSYKRTADNAELVRTINKELVNLKDVKWDMLRKTSCCVCSDAKGMFGLYFDTLKSNGVITGDRNNCCIADGWKDFISQL